MRRLTSLKIGLRENDGILLALTLSIAAFNGDLLETRQLAGAGG